MKTLISVAAAMVAAAGIAGAQVAASAPTKTPICHKTNSTTKPYQRILVAGSVLKAHKNHPGDIIPARKTCPQTLLSTTGGTAIDVTLRGVSEQPDLGDPDGSGTATLRLRAGQGQICYSLSAKDVTLPASAAHIHRGPIDQAGPVVVPLGTPNASGTAKGCANAARSLVQTILQSRSSFYVNVHTSDFPAGAVRAQLAMPSNVKLLSTTLTGPNERPSAGDSDGAGTATFLFFPDTSKICYTIAVRNIILPTIGSHIHRGGADVAGPVVVPLQQPGESGMSSGCTTADAALVREIAQDPTGFYANVHTRDYPAGAIRGQLPAS